MSTVPVSPAVPVSPFVAVGDPEAAACEGDFCAVPEVRERDATREGQELDLSPADKAPAPAARS